MHEGRLREVHVATPVEVCIERDVKGLYARQRSGTLRGLTGIDDPYEALLSPEVVVPTPVEEPVGTIWHSITEVDGARAG